MARARNVKPSLFKNELLGTDDPFLTLLFISLWTLADKAGRLEDRPLRIKAETFPYRENMDVNGYLTQLEQMGFIDRYEADGMKIISICKFEEHQSPHSTEKASQLPAKPMNSGLTVKPALNNESSNVDSNINVLIPDSLFIDSLIHEPNAPQAAKPKQKRAPSKTPLSENFQISERVKTWAEEKGHRFLQSHFDHFVSACKRRGYTYADWDEALMSAIRDNWAKIDPAKMQQVQIESARPAKPDGDYVWRDGKWIHRNFLGVK